jgi:hypothetical protein
MCRKADVTTFGGPVFHSKSKTEQLQDQSSSLASSASSVAEQLRERVVPAVGQAAGSAKEWGQPRVEAARDWAKPRVEHGIEVAAPKLESVVTGLAPKVDTARDKIVDDLLPRLTEAINAFAAASAAAKEEAMARGAGAAAVISGDAVAAPKRKKKGRVLLILGLFTAAAAGAAAFMKKSAPKDDPWATPLAEPYLAPSTGRHSGVSPVADTTDATASPNSAHPKPELIESVDDAGGSDVLDPAADAGQAAKDNKGKGPRS